MKTSGAGNTCRLRGMGKSSDRWRVVLRPVYRACSSGMPPLPAVSGFSAHLASLLLVLLGGGGAPAWELLPIGMQTWFVLTMTAPAVIDDGVLAWWPDSNDRVHFR